MTRAASVISAIDLVEAHIAMGAGALVRARHRNVAALPADELALHTFLADATTELTGETGRPKASRPSRNAAKRNRRRRRQKGQVTMRSLYATHGIWNVH